MSLITLLTDPILIGAVGTIIGSVIGYFATKNNNKKDLAINDRMQLSKDQYQLISELRQMMTEQRDEIEGLREEIRQLQAVNINLTIENRELQKQIQKLTDKLDDMETRR